MQARDFEADPAQAPGREGAARELSRSIKHTPLGNGEAPAVPDLRGAGVIARIFLAVNALVFAAALVAAHDAGGFPERLLALLALAEPPLILTLVLLFLIAPGLRAMPWRRFSALVAGLAVLATTAVLLAIGPDMRQQIVGGGLPAALAWSIAASGIALYYLYLRARAFSPALAEARLMALTARIRPHFLFNSLNAVLGTMRNDPRRAEAALEELAELFRALMAEKRELVALSDEIKLARQYLDLEKLRLGERLVADWRIEGAPGEALVPPLMLQPLIENAVYHGIEPSVEAGAVIIDIALRGDVVVIEIRNPYHGDGRHPGGNRIALANIRERLALFFDLQASLATRIEGGEHRLSIRFPYRRKP